MANPTKLVVDCSSGEGQELPLTDADIIVIPLDNVKAAKLNELNAACEKSILAGFTSAALGVEHMYQFSIYDQMNLIGQLALVNADASIASVTWKTEAGELAHARDQFIAVCKDAGTHKRGKIERYRTLAAQVQAATTADMVNAIVW